MDLESITRVDGSWIKRMVVRMPRKVDNFRISLEHRINYTRAVVECHGLNIIGRNNQKLFQST